MVKGFTSFFSVSTALAHVKRGGTSRTAEQQFSAPRTVLREKVQNAKAVFPKVEVEMPEECAKVHKIRMTFLQYLLGQKSEHAVLQMLRALEPGTRGWRYAVSLMDKQPLENFVREFDAGSRSLWRMVASAADDPLLQFVMVVATRFYLVQGSRIEAVEEALKPSSLLSSLRCRHHVPTGAAFLQACRKIGPGNIHKMPYKVFGKGEAFKKEWHECEV
jgi:hypothetical protein